MHILFKTKNPTKPLGEIFFQKEMVVSIFCVPEGMCSHFKHGVSSWGPCGVCRDGFAWLPHACAAAQDQGTAASGSAAPAAQLQ